MRNRIVIEPHDGGFKGFLYDGESLIYETSLYSDPSLASKDLMKKMQEGDQEPTRRESSRALNTTTASPLPPVIAPKLSAIESTNSPQPQRLKKSCCGRS
jgi:hypothetical protein